MHSHLQITTLLCFSNETISGYRRVAFSLCTKHSLCVAQTVDRLKQHVDYVVVRLSTSKKSRTGLVVPAKSAVGKKGGTHKNARRPQKSESNDSASAVQPQFLVNSVVKSFLAEKPSSHLTLCYPTKKNGCILMPTI